jgi:hypothetical protein
VAIGKSRFDFGGFGFFVGGGVVGLIGRRVANGWPVWFCKRCLAGGSFAGADFIKSPGPLTAPVLFEPEACGWSLVFRSKTVGNVQAGVVVIES